MRIGKVLLSCKLLVLLSQQFILLPLKLCHPTRLVTNALLDQLHTQQFNSRIDAPFISYCLLLQWSNRRSKQRRIHPRFRLGRIGWRFFLQHARIAKQLQLLSNGSDINNYAFTAIRITILSFSVD